MTYAELSALTIQEKERIPTYEDAVRLCRQLGLWANVEIKPAKGHERATGDAVARMSRELWKGASVAPLLSSFSPEALAAAQEAAPEFPRGGLCDKLPDGWRSILKQLGCKAMIVMPVTTPTLKVDAVRALGGNAVLHGESYTDAFNHALVLEK